MYSQVYDKTYLVDLGLAFFKILADSLSAPAVFVFLPVYGTVVRSFRKVHMLLFSLFLM